MLLGFQAIWGKFVSKPDKDSVFYIEIIIIYLVLNFNDLCVIVAHVSVSLDINKYIEPAKLSF